MKSIYFCRPRNPYGCFSNFSWHSIIVNGKYYATTEHFYQACKSISPENHEFVRLAPTAKLSKTRSRSCECRSDWDSIRIDIMRQTIRYKFDQHKVVQEALLSTGDAELVEYSTKDTFWGRGPDGVGENWLGKLWMELREQQKPIL